MNPFCGAMDVADKISRGMWAEAACWCCQLQWCNSGLKPAVTLLTTLENSWNRKAAFIYNAVLTRGNCSWTVLWECRLTFYFWLFSCAWETIGLDWLFCSWLPLLMCSLQWRWDIRFVILSEIKFICSRITVQYKVCLLYTSPSPRN